MFNDTATSRTPWQVFCFVATVSISLATAAAALAGECPADKFKANARQMVDFKPVGVTDVTLGSIDLGKQPAHIEGRELRFRKLTIEPGGIVPWHSHDDRPALIFVQQGEIVEYASNCIDPIVHKAGDLRPEVYGTSHWSAVPVLADRRPLYRCRATSICRLNGLPVSCLHRDVASSDSAANAMSSFFML